MRQIAGQLAEQTVQGHWSVIPLQCPGQVARQQQGQGLDQNHRFLPGKGKGCDHLQCSPSLQSRQVEEDQPKKDHWLRFGRQKAKCGPLKSQVDLHRDWRSGETRDKQDLAVNNKLIQEERVRVQDFLCGGAETNRGGTQQNEAILMDHDFLDI